MRALLSIVVLLVVTVVGQAQTASVLVPQAYLPLVFKPPVAELANNDFEGLWIRDEARRWNWPWQTPQDVLIPEIITPEGWTTWYVEQRPCIGHHDAQPWKTGQPEVGEITLARRVYSGSSALQQFTFYYCNLVGVFQRPRLPVGTYEVCGQVHAWFSRCSFRPYDPPYDYDCETPIYWAKALARVGIDTTGQVDFWDAGTLTWGEPVEIYGSYGRVCSEPFTLTQDSQVSVWLRGETDAPLKHNDWYWDHIRVRRIE